jgi:threonine aldolase
MKPFNRRNFLKVSGLSVLPSLIPFGSSASVSQPQDSSLPKIKFYGDGEMFEPGEYINKLQKANAVTEISKDRYGAGGVIEILENKFVELTGKEKAIFMPSGTMANQFAIAELSGENSKVFVQDMSHVFRDEADAAQSVFNKRLMPLAMGGTYFTAEELSSAIESLKGKEVFNTGIGAISIENPVRRTDGRVVPLQEIIGISRYCKQNNIKTHLDGARIHIAAAWTGVSVKEYASYFDTVYISLYKYFGAAAGAMLCGPAAVIDKMSHLIKIHGGSMYGNWANAAMALHRMEGFDARIKNTVSRTKEIITGVNKISGIKISPLEGGTNIYALDLDSKIDGRNMQQILNKDYNMVMARPDQNNRILITMNETLLYQPVDFIINAFKKSI